MDRWELEKFYTVDEAYQPLGYTHRQGLYRDIRLGNFTAFVKFGAKIRIPASAIEAMIKGQIKANEERAKACAEAA